MQGAEPPWWTWIGVEIFFSLHMFAQCQQAYHRPQSEAQKSENSELVI